MKYSPLRNHELFYVEILYVLELIVDVIIMSKRIFYGGITMVTAHGYQKIISISIIVILTAKFMDFVYETLNKKLVIDHKP